MRKSQDIEKGRIEVKPAISFVSDATYHDYHDCNKDKPKFIEVMRYIRSSNKNSMRMNRQNSHSLKYYWNDKA